MIKNFKTKATEQVFDGVFVKKLPSNITTSARRKLYWISAAKDLRDLRTPPGNHLEKLHGERTGQHSIRINNQWRICFVWKDGHAYDVEIVDYH